jgi:hypothetical protein
MSNPVCFLALVLLECMTIQYMVWYSCGTQAASEREGEGKSILRVMSFFSRRLVVHIHTQIMRNARLTMRNRDAATQRRSDAATVVHGALYHSSCSQCKQRSKECGDEKRWLSTTTGIMDDNGQDENGNIIESGKVVATSIP